MLLPPQVMADHKAFNHDGDSMKSIADKDGIDAFEFKMGLIKRGDIMGVRGLPGKSRKGELSIFPSQVRACRY